jgi:hypothetical protein
MDNGPRLFTTLTALLTGLPWSDVRHMHTFVWMLVGLLSAQTVNLDAWVPYVVSRAVQAASTVCRFRRWLGHPAVHIQPLYAPLVQQALREWSLSRVYVALDTSLLWEQFCVIRLALVYRGRAIPLVWDVLEHASSSVAYATYAPLLDQLAALLPAHLKVVLLADRGFADTELLAHCKRLRWHYRIRIKGNFTCYRRGRQFTVAQVTLAPGQACFLDHVHLTADYYGPVYLALAHPLGGSDPWYIVSDEPVTQNTFQQYGQRFDIEENFLDDKSNGFQLEASELHDAAGLTRLGLVLAVATLFLVAQGVEVVRSGARRWIDAHWFRGHSYFRLGWDWVRRALVRGEALLSRWHLPDGPDPQPACASRQQHAARQSPPFTIIVGIADAV